MLHLLLMASLVLKFSASKICALVLLWIGSLQNKCYAEQAPNYTFVKEASKVSPLHDKYDYIIVGGGTAGCPLAATLSSNYRVLVLERGGVPYGNENITRLEKFPQTIADDRPDSPGQLFISTDGVINTRARVLGGGTCLNAGFYSRASPEYVAKVGWNGSLVNESYPWVEAVVANVPDVQQWQSGVRNGLIEAGVVPYNGETFDHLPGTKVGGSTFDRNGNRHTAADLLQYANPANITVLVHATVHRILFRTKDRDRPQAYAVLYSDKGGSKHKAYLDRNVKGSEIIISAGALGSPQLMMLSGIGPADHLRSFNITVLLDNPAVGAKMVDNPMNAIFVPSPTPVEISLIQVVGITPFNFIEAASGFTGKGGTPIVFMPNVGIKIGQLATYPAGQRTEERIAEAVAQVRGAPVLQGEALAGGFLLEKVIGPLSNGDLRLLTTNINDNPSVTFNYFADPADLQACVEGIRTIEKVVNSGSFKDFRYPGTTFLDILNITSNLPFNLIPHQTNDSTSLEQFCRDTVTTFWHYHGGSHVGHVISPSYHVLGVDALRIIDGSTWNFSPGTNPQATVMMLGRYMGVQILRERA